jgi:hypothetical protein
MSKTKEKTLPPIFLLSPLLEEKPEQLLLKNPIKNDPERGH